MILADEPVASLDPASAATVLSALHRVAADDGIAVVCSLHQVDMVCGFADRVLGLRQGRLVLDRAASRFDDRARALVYPAGVARQSREGVVAP